MTLGGNLTGGLLTYELAAGAAGNIPGLAQRINSISGRLSAYPILNRIGQDHISNIIGATVIDTGVLTLPGAIGDIARGERPENVFKNAGLDMGRNLLFNIGGEAISGALGAVLKRGERGSLSDDRISYYLNESLNNADSNTTILGATGSYDVIAETQGYSYFKMEDDLWSKLENETIKNYDEIWKVNKQFIDDQIEAGNRILLSNDPYQGYYFADGTKRFYQRELDYLKELGYSFENVDNNLWEAVK